MKKIFVLIIFSLLISPPLLATTGTSSAVVKFYKGYISANGDCSDPTVFYNAEDDTDNRIEDGDGNYYIEVDFNAVPTIGTGTISEGTYYCVIFEMSDQITFSPEADDGAGCEASETYTIDVCYDYGSGSPSIYDPENETTSTCTAASGTEDMVWTYVSTWSTATEGAEDHQAFLPPSSNGDADRGFSLSTGEISFTEDMTGTFIFGTADKVATQGASCGMEPPDFGFTTSSS